MKDVSSQQRAQQRYQAYLRSRQMTLPPRSIGPDWPASAGEFDGWRTEARRLVQEALDIPDCTLAPNVEIVGETTAGKSRMQRLLYEAEDGLYVTASLYIPPTATRPAPALVMASGHGGSKSTFWNQYAGQLYAQLGCYVMIPDTVGEEERDIEVTQGTRGHRRHFYIDRGFEAGRSVMGKMVLDILRGVDVVLAMPEVDSSRVGCAGHSLGCTIAMFVAALHPEVRLCLPASWISSYKQRVASPSCEWRVPSLLQIADQAELLAMAAPHCATLIQVGDRDYPDDGVQAAYETFAAVQRVYALYGAFDRVALHVTENGGHRPYFLCPEAYSWVARHFDLGPLDEPLETVRLGDWANARGIRIEDLYALEVQYAGTSIVKADVELQELEDMVCFAPGDPKRALVTVETWMQRIEERKPPAPKDWTTLADWERERLRLRRLFVRLLGVEGAPAADRSDVAVQSISGALNPSIVQFEAYRVSLTRLGQESYWIIPLEGSRQTRREHEDWLSPLLPGDRSEVRNFGSGGPGSNQPRVVVYLPPTRDKDEGLNDAHWRSWLARGWSVYIMDQLISNDEGILIGEPTPGANVLLVRDAITALRFLVKERFGVDPFIVCYDACGDTGLWTMALDERLDALVSTRVEDGPGSARYRRSGTIPRIAVHAARQEVMRLAAPRRLTCLDAAARPRRDIATPWWMGEDPWQPVSQVFALYERGV